MTVFSMTPAARLWINSDAKVIAFAADIGQSTPPFEIWIEGLEVLTQIFETGLLGDGGLACLECPPKADVAGALPSNLRIVRDLVGSASRVVMIEKTCR